MCVKKFENNKMKFLLLLISVLTFFNGIKTQNVPFATNTLYNQQPAYTFNTTPDPPIVPIIHQNVNSTEIGMAPLATAVTPTIVTPIVYSAPNNFPPYNFVPESGVCQSITIMNNIRDFKQLEGCRVIEGFLHIIDVTANSTQYANITFPLLKEVTMYVAIVHVRGLKSLGNLFPNLAVIRGDKQLIRGYSLIIFENYHLEDIGLQSLKHIGRGAVRIDNNPNLCYANTIDWAKISPHASISFHFIVNNKQFNCSACEPIVVHKDNQEICANAVNQTYSFYKDRRILCWNTTLCQRLCPIECKSHGCTLFGECCHASCLGGCTQANSPHHCNSCLHKIYNGQCVENCPEGTVLFNGRRCITHDHCKSQLRSTLSAIQHKEELALYPYFPYDGDCVLECPTNTIKSFSNAITSCVSTLPAGTLKKCPGGIIHTKADVLKFKNCYHVLGSLTIDSDSQLSTAKLEEGLKQIKIIDGYLAMIGTHGETSPKTLKSLSNLITIKGEELYQNKFAIFMLFNENLRTVFTHTIEVKRGSLFFAMNPSLCSSRIRKTQQLLTERSGSCCDTFDIGNDPDC